MDKSALHRFFLNECSPAERKEVLDWLLNPENDLMIKTWMKENWDLVPLTGADNSSGDPDVQKIWNDLSQKLFARDRDAILNKPGADSTVDHLNPDLTGDHLDLHPTAHHPGPHSTPDHVEPDSTLEPNNINANVYQLKDDSFLATVNLQDKESDSNPADPEPTLHQHEVSNADARIIDIKKRANRKRWFAAAASVIVALGVFAYAYRESILYVRYQTDFAEVSEFKLPDGSRVVLNANSSLLVPRWGFNNGDRKVELQGEAAFDVTHTINHKKFLVATNSQLNVEVLGTEFLLYSRNNTNKVILKKGSVKVQFNDEQRQPVLMKPGDVVTADKAGSLSVKHQQPVSNSIPWKEHRFQFDSTTLAEAVVQISEFFGDIIVINDETLGNKTLSGSYSAATARELLTILSEIYNLEIQQTNTKIILKKRTSVMLDR